MFFPCPKDPSCLQPRFVSTDPGMTPGRTEGWAVVSHSLILLQQQSQAIALFPQSWVHQKLSLGFLAFPSLALAASKRTKILMWIMRYTKKHEAHTHSNQDRGLKSSRKPDKSIDVPISAQLKAAEVRGRTNDHLQDPTWHGATHSLPKSTRGHWLYLVLRHVARGLLSHGLKFHFPRQPEHYHL